VINVTEEDRYLTNPCILPVFWGHSYTLTSHCHVRECVIDTPSIAHSLKWQCDVNWLIIGFTDNLQILTTNNYSAIVYSHTLQYTTACTKFLLSSPVIAWQRLSAPDVLFTLGSRIIPLLQLPAFESNGSQRLNCSSPLAKSLTNQSSP
jgi:hypothetical protein